MATETQPAFYIPNYNEVNSDENGTVTFYDDGTATFRSEHYTVDIGKHATRALRATGQCPRPSIVLKKK